MASQGPTTTTTEATSTSGVTTETRSGEAGSRPSAGEVDSMAGKRKSPEPNTEGAVPGTPREVQDVVHLISTTDDRSRCAGAGRQAGQAGGVMLRHEGVMGHPKDGPVMQLPMNYRNVSIPRWKYYGYRKQDNTINDIYKLSAQKIPEEELKKMYFPGMWEKAEKEKIKTKFDLIAKVIHPKYQEYSQEYERVTKKFQQLCGDCNRYGIKCGEIEEFLNFVAQNREVADKLGVKL